MTSSREILEKIHHINSTLNRRLSWLIYLGAAVTVFLLLLLPYRGRVALAFFINIFFNRPIVYLNYAARYIAKPLGQIHAMLLYFILFGAYAVFYRWLAKPRRSGWVESHPAQSKEDFFYQS